MLQYTSFVFHINTPGLFPQLVGKNEHIVLTVIVENIFQRFRHSQRTIAECLMFPK